MPEQQASWQTKVPNATSVVPDRETGAPLVLDDKGHVWRQNPDSPGEPQDAGKWNPSMMDLLKMRQESQQDQTKTTQNLQADPLPIKPAVKPAPPPTMSGSSPGTTFVGPETEIKGRTFQDMKMPQKKSGTKK